MRDSSFVLVTFPLFGEHETAGNARNSNVVGNLTFCRPLREPLALQRCSYPVNMNYHFGIHSDEMGLLVLQRMNQINWVMQVIGTIYRDTDKSETTS